MLGTHSSPETSRHRCSMQHGMQGQETLLPLQHAVMMQGQSLKLLTDSGTEQARIAWCSRKQRWVRYGSTTVPEETRRTACPAAAGRLPRSRWTAIAAADRPCDVHVAVAAAVAAAVAVASRATQRTKRRQGR